MAETTVFQQLRDSLADLAGFLEDKADDIRPIIQNIASFIPQVNDLIDVPVDLLTSLANEINRLSEQIPASVEEALGFATRVKSVIESARTILPSQSDRIDDVAEIADLVAGLPSLDQLKDEIINLITTVQDLLRSLKSVPA